MTRKAIQLTAEELLKVVKSAHHLTDDERTSLVITFPHRSRVVVETDRDILKREDILIIHDEPRSASTLEEAPRVG